jgi:hypothetical protein
MADYISGIRHITPTYPVKPVQPASKDRETDRRKKPSDERPDQKETDQQGDDGEDRQPTIDEHV